MISRTSTGSIAVVSGMALIWVAAIGSHSGFWITMALLITVVVVLEIAR